MTILEEGLIDEQLLQALISRGHDAKLGSLNSGIHAIEIDAGVLTGGADHRREGQALAR